MKEDKPVNVFVLGDIIFDHLIPVDLKRGAHHAAGKEIVYDGQRRETIVGGAANTARLAAALGGGTVCLWGLSGYSPWGSFTQILERSQSREGVGNPIVYHGADSSSHPMNTITRVVRVEKGQIVDRLYRIDGLPKVGVTDRQADDAISYLEREHERIGVDAIILNDLQMGALSPGLVQRVAEFARLNRILIFVDPKRDWKKFAGITVFCTMPNLDEWCALIQQSLPGKGDKETWKAQLEHGRDFDLFALHSLRCMPDADVHIIKRDEEGAILIARAEPSAHKSEQRWAVYQIPAHPISNSHPIQIGMGDILIAAFAIEMVRCNGNKHDINQILGAFQRASRVVACYLELDWQRVPNAHAMHEYTARAKKVTHAPSSSGPRRIISGGVRYLPAPNVDHDLSTLAVKGTALISADPEYHRVINDLVDSLKDNRRAQSAILFGKGGSGKSDVLTLLGSELKPLNCVVWSPEKWTAWNSIATVVDAIRTKRAELEKEYANLRDLVVVVDEAFKADNAKNLLFGVKGVELLESVRKLASARFVFADADYLEYKPQLDASQFLSRCEEYQIPPLSKRVHDIPFIFAGMCCSALRTTSIRISEATLLAIINWALEDGCNPRNLKKEADAASFSAQAEKKSNLLAHEISRHNLRQHVLETLGRWDDPKKFIRFEWRREIA